jgi:hypothetical protein
MTVNVTPSLAHGLLRQEYEQVCRHGGGTYDDMFRLRKQKTGPRFRESIDKVRRYIHGREIMESIHDVGSNSHAMWVAWAPLAPGRVDSLRFCIEMLRITMRGPAAGIPSGFAGGVIVTEHVMMRILQRLKTTDVRKAMRTVNSAIIPLCLHADTAFNPTPGPIHIGVPGGMLIGVREIDDGGICDHIITFVDDAKLTPDQKLMIGEPVDKSSLLRGMSRKLWADDIWLPKIG